MVLLPILEKSMTKISKKQEIRKQVYALRKAMPKEEWEAKSKSIAKTLQQTSAYKSARSIYCYVDYNHEVGTRSLILDAWKAGKKYMFQKFWEKRWNFLR